MDRALGAFLSSLASEARWRGLLTVLTSDHGEGLGEHGEKTHCLFVYQSTLRVPLIVHWPGVLSPRRVSVPVDVIDTAPTILELAQLPGLPGVEGQSLARLMKRPRSSGGERVFYFESLLGALDYGWAALRGIRSGNLKYISAPRPELYDLIEDPGETNNLVVQESERARALQDKLRTMLEESIPVHGSDSKASLDEEARERLESLGYLGGASVSEDFEFDQSKEDPKNLIGYHNLKREAGNLVVEERFEEAREVCEQMLRERPQAFDTHYWLARIAKAENDNAAVVRHLSEAIRLKPDETKTRYELGVTLLEMNEIDAAMTHLNEALRIMPWSAELHNNVGIALAKKRRLAEAIEHFSEALRISPEFAVARSNLERAKMLQGKQQ